ncbi:hypothetical protein ACFPRL_27485 [Pseudoclavibacter helvolus]
MLEVGRVKAMLATRHLPDRFEQAPEPRLRVTPNDPLHERVPSSTSEPRSPRVLPSCVRTPRTRRGSELRGRRTDGR